jgi:hypothetical protein
MKLISLMLLSSAVVAMTVGAGVMHGRWTNRWGHRPDILSASVRLEQLPMAIGEWQAKDDDPMDPATERLLQCAGKVNRVYENDRTGERVSVAVLLGPAGPIAVHTPEVCYSSQNYRVESDRRRWQVNDAVQPGDEFWDLRMQSNDVSAAPFRVLYGWTLDKQWHATENPRFTFGGSSYLYKLQLAGPVPGEDQKADACRDFLDAFLPVLRKHMIESR